MRVTFGASLDARQGPSAGSFFDEPLVGPMGLLGLLETYLGLAAPEVPVARRVAIYLGALQQADAEQPRFYRASLQADGFGTAARLLDWRDTWMLGGWAGQAGDGAPPRIADLAAAEQAAASTLPPGLTERLAACAAALRSLAASGAAGRHPGPHRRRPARMGRPRQRRLRARAHRHRRRALSAGRGPAPERAAASGSSISPGWPQVSSACCSSTPNRRATRFLVTS